MSVHHRMEELESISRLFSVQSDETLEQKSHTTSGLPLSVLSPQQSLRLNSAASSSPNRFQKPPFLTFATEARVRKRQTSNKRKYAQWER